MRFALDVLREAVQPNIFNALTAVLAVAAGATVAFIVATIRK